MKAAEIGYKKPFELGFFLYVGGPRQEGLLEPYVWGARGIHDLVANRLQPSYGSGLRYIQVEYYVFGGLDSIQSFPKRKISNFAAKQMAIRTIIPVLPTDFHRRKPRVRATFVAEALLFSIEGVKKRLEARFPKFNFQALHDDAQALVPEYLSAWR